MVMLPTQIVWVRPVKISQSHSPAHASISFSVVERPHVCSQLSYLLQAGQLGLGRAAWIWLKPLARAAEPQDYHDILERRRNEPKLHLLRSGSWPCPTISIPASLASFSAHHRPGRVSSVTEKGTLTDCWVLMRHSPPPSQALLQQPPMSTTNQPS